MWRGRAFVNGIPQPAQCFVRLYKAAIIILSFQPYRPNVAGLVCGQFESLPIEGVQLRGHLEVIQPISLNP